MYVNYFSIEANTILREAERNDMSLKNSAVDRFARNTDLRYDERTNRTCVHQLRDALGNKKLKQKSVRQGAKWLIKCLTDIFPDNRTDAPRIEPKIEQQVSEQLEEVVHGTQEGQDEAVLPTLPELPAPAMEPLDEARPQVQTA